MFVKTIRWEGSLEDGQIVIIDQTLLPLTEKEISITDVEAMWEAIKVLRVRGAPAIGIAAAFGAVLGIRNFSGSCADCLQKLEEVCQYLETSRPTAVNLFWALNRMRHTAKNISSIEEIKQTLWQEAQKILDEDLKTGQDLGKYGGELIKEGANVLTHCNAGGLATSGYGTALGVILSAFKEGKKIHVFVDETRPLLQGARLTTWELMKAKIPSTLICDNTAGYLMQQGKIDFIVTGADRIAANGDTANKIGTYSVAVLASAHKIPFYIAAPLSTFDASLKNGAEIPIEERKAEEVTEFGEKRVAPHNVQVYSPAFDVTPAQYIAGIITEHGVLAPPYEKSIAQVLKKA